jgi:hypothetical protein
MWQGDPSRTIEIEIHEDLTLPLSLSNLMFLKGGGIKIDINTVEYN